MEITLFMTVLYRNMECIVTNSFAHGGKKITISPKGNGKLPAKYYTVFPDEVKIIINPLQPN